MLQYTIKVDLFESNVWLNGLRKMSLQNIDESLREYLI